MTGFLRRPFNNLFLITGLLLAPSAQAYVTPEMVHPWATNLSDQLIGELVVKINDEKTMAVESSIPNRKFGNTFPGLFPVQIDCLREIHQRHKEVGNVQVLDVGAGHGLMTWKALVAGGTITAIELERSAALYLQKNLSFVKPYLKKDRSIKENVRIVVGDFLKVDSKPLENKFDIIWSGNNLHFFTPTQTLAYIQKLFSLLKPGGKVYLTTLAPSTTPDYVSTYIKAREDNHPFPGYMVSTEGEPQGKEFVMDRPGGGKKAMRFPIGVASLPEDSQLLPASEYEGPYGRLTKLEPEVASLIDKLKNKGVPYKTLHIPAHFFDDATLRRLFTDAGFQVDVTFIAFLNEGAEERSAITDEERQKESFQSVVRATKPL